MPKVLYFVDTGQNNLSFHFEGKFMECLNVQVSDDPCCHFTSLLISPLSSLKNRILLKVTSTVNDRTFFIYLFFEPMNYAKTNVF